MTTSETPTEILIADDDPVVRHILTSMLKPSGFLVKTVTTGGSCITCLQKAAAASTLPALLFLDLQLLDMTGAEVLKAIRETISPERLPVAVLSANSEHEAQKNYPGLNYEFFLEKPFVQARILEVIHSVISKVL